MDKNVLASMNGQFDKKNETFVKRVQIGHALGGIYGFRYKGVYAYDYDHNGYFQNEEKNKYVDAAGM